MASLLYIPTNDPFAILGIILLFTLLIAALILLTITARRSAMNARKAVHDEARYQRLQQSTWREERRALQNMGKGKGKARVASTPMIVLTAPSTAPSVRSGSVCGELAASRQGKTYEPIGGKYSAESAEDEGDLSTATTSLLGNQSGPSEGLTRENDPLPKTLRLGQPYGQFRRAPGYKPVAKRDPDGNARKRDESR